MRRCPSRAPRLPSTEANFWLCSASSAKGTSASLSKSSPTTFCFLSAASTQNTPYWRSMNPFASGSHTFSPSLARFSRVPMIPGTKMIGTVSLRTEKLFGVPASRSF